MKKTSKIIFTILILLLLSINVQAGLLKVAQSSIQFLKIDMCPRSAGIGGAYTMIGNDASAMFSNPAGLSLIEKDYDVFVSNNTWIAGISYLSGAGAINLQGIGTFGVSWVRANYGKDFYGTQIDNSDLGFRETGSLAVEAFNVGLSYSNRLTDKFTVGGQIKYLYQHLGGNMKDEKGKLVWRQNELNIVSYDFGTMYYTGFKSLRVGMTIRNFGTSYTYEVEQFELPLTFTLGAAMDILDLINDQHEDALLVSLEGVHPRDYYERIHLGAEYTYNKMLSLRAGYKFNYDIEGFSAGIGIIQPIDDFVIKVDYAYSVLKDFDASHRISLGISY